MAYIGVFAIGMVGGGFIVFLWVMQKKRALDEGMAKCSKQLSHAKRERVELDQAMTALRAEQEEFRSRVIAYDELHGENSVLKRDIQNIDVELRKLKLDRENQGRRQEEIDARTESLGTRYLDENVKWLSTKLTPTNFVNTKARLQKVIEACRGIGLEIPDAEEARLIDYLKNEFEMVVRADFEKQEQARIRAQIREEQKLQREIDREIQQLDREQKAIKAALEKALAEAKDEHSAEVERLRERLREAEERSQRAISQAQLTKAGHVYVISNVGSFGDGVFKIGMTRRLEPHDRVRELSSASVPFPYDIHMMISCDDAPTLENLLHRALHTQRINKVNPRKEFFRAEIEAIRRLVEENHGEVSYVADAEALEYRQSLDMSEEDSEFIEQTYAALEGDEEDEEVVEEV